MGASMQAVKAKLVERKGSPYFKVGSSTMQGRRREMEDSHTIILKLKSHKNYSFLAVYDGHGGSKASYYCSKQLHKRIDRIVDSEFVDKDLCNAVVGMDQDFIKTFKKYSFQGSTCVFVLLQNQPDLQMSGIEREFKVIVGNVGDSRCIRGTIRHLGDTGSEGKDYIRCTKDHVPSNRMEFQRICKAGGYIAMGRVDGDLNLSRAIGDAQYKQNADIPFNQQKVISEPDFMRYSIRDDDWLLLACDGIFERLDTKAIIDFVNEGLRKCKDPGQVASDLCTYAFDSGSTDNLSVIILYVSNGYKYVSNEDNSEKLIIP